MEELLRMSRGREFQVVGAKHVRPRGTANKLQSGERSLRTVSIQSEDRQADSFVSDAGDLKLDARLDRQPM